MSSNAQNSNRRAIILIVDGCGVGAAPDAQEFGDQPTCNSLANTAKATGGLNLPNMQRLGLGNVTPIQGVAQDSDPQGFFGKLEEQSNAKDTQAGHWEMMGVVSAKGFPTYPDGFPPEVIDRFIEETGCKQIYVNKPASGTQVLDQWGSEHQKTGYPIVYTSGDSVFQIACHVDTVPLKTLYRYCEVAREILNGDYRAGRVIARPFNGTPGNYKRLSKERRDYGVKPPKATYLDFLFGKNLGVLGIGKIEDIFDKQGITHAIHTGTNKEGLELTLDAIAGKFDLPAHKIVDNAPDAVPLIFTNLVDTDATYGHRRNVEGYAGALKEIDEWVGKIMQEMHEDDLLIITSDHGNDPTAPGTDHTREYVPLLAYSKALDKTSFDKKNIGIRKGFADIAASIAQWLGSDWPGPGVSFIPQLTKVA
jgi:phosphopentomutase